MTFLILYGDRRQVLLSELLRMEGHEVRLVTGSEDEARAALLYRYDAVILPIPVSRDGVFVTGTRLPLSEVLSALPPDTAVFGGRLSGEAHPMAFDYLTDESFTLKNADLTAEGTLRLIYENTERALSELRVMILGYGRIAKLLLRRLSVLARAVTVVARRLEAVDEAALFGAEALPFGSFLPHADIVVNTVPPPFSPPPVRDCLLVDLAGISVTDGALLENVRLLPAPALPGRFFPVSAARTVYDTTIRQLGRRLDFH